MKKVYSEIGFGNDTFLSTEIEEGENEYRIPKFVLPNKIKSLYFRFWIFKTVFILSTNNGFEIKKKDRNKLKIIFGIGGENISRQRTAVIVVKDNKLLLIHRINNGKEYYVFPGGGREENESLEEGALRELSEETTIEGKIDRLVYKVMWDNGDENYFYLCDYISGEPELRKDSEEYAEMKLGKQVYEPMWVDISKLPELLVYQLEIRDLFIEDLKNGFGDKVKELKIKVLERREK